MKAKPLTKTNTYLKDPAQRRKLNKRAARSSCGVEGIKVTSIKIMPPVKRREKKLFKKLRAKFSSD